MIRNHENAKNHHEKTQTKTRKQKDKAHEKQSNFKWGTAMSISILTGKVSHVDHSTETSGNITANRGGQIRSAHAWSLRINNRPAIYKSRSTASFSEGDVLTAAGADKNGTFKIVSCRNETTGAVYEAPATLVCVCAGVIILLSLPLLLVAVGFLLLPLGIYFLMIGLKMSKANNLLRVTTSVSVPS